MNPSSHQITGKLTIQYALTLVLLGGLALANYVILAKQIVASRSVVNIVSLSGRQRALLQHSAVLARQLASPEHRSDRTRIRKELLATVRPMEQTHHQLIRNDASVPPPESVPRIYYDAPWMLDTEMRNFIAQVRSLAEAPDDELGADHPQVTYLWDSASGGPLTEGLDAVVAAYRGEAEEKSRRLQELAVWSLGSTVALLGISGWSIFRPMVARVRSDMDALSGLNASLESRVAERTALAENRAAALASSERAFREQSRILQSILDNMGDGVIVADMDGPFQLFNPKAREIFGIGSADEIPDIRQPGWTKACRLDLLRPDGVTPYPLEELPHMRAFRGESVDHQEILIVLPDSPSATSVSVTARPLFSGAERVRGVVAVVRDITETKEAERKLLQSERLAAIGQMVAGVAHESRNALQQIQACCGLLGWKLDGDIETRGLIQDIEKAQVQLHRLFDDVRDYAAPVKLERSRHDVKDILAESWAAIEHLRRQREVSLQVPSTAIDTCMNVDALRLEQVFRNVLENALAACSDPVAIEIVFSDTAIEGEKAMEITIGDNGPGMSDEQRERIFEPFFTTKSRGTGLGMAITRRIVEAHGGRVAVAPRLKSGTEIMVTIPRGKP